MTIWNVSILLIVLLLLEMTSIICDDFHDDSNDFFLKKNPAMVFLLHNYVLKNNAYCEASHNKSVSLTATWLEYYLRHFCPFFTFVWFYFPSHAWI